jgi:hypothetical protein
MSELDPKRYERFEEFARAALESLPPDLQQWLSNVEIVVEEEPPPGQRLLDLYQGVPLTRRGNFYTGVLRDGAPAVPGGARRVEPAADDFRTRSPDRLGSGRA